MKHQLITTVIAILMMSVSTFAKTSVSWSPSKITTEASPSNATIINVNLNFHTDQNNINLRIVPSLAKMIELEPSQIESATAGESIPIKISIVPPPESIEGLIDGTIQVRSGKKNLAKPLPVEINVVLNPLMDIDADADGVWDNIQSFIEANYQDEPDIYDVVVKYVINLQDAIVNAEDKNSSITTAIKIKDDLECLYSIRSSDALEISKNIRAALLNSKVRTQSYLQYNEQLGGQVFPMRPLSEKSSACGN